MMMCERETDCTFYFKSRKSLGSDQKKKNLDNVPNYTRLIDCTCTSFMAIIIHYDTYEKSVIIKMSK